MVIRRPTTCPIPQLLLRAIRRQLRGAMAMERVPRISPSLMPDRRRDILATPLVTPKATPTNRSINSSTAGSLSLLRGMAVQDMAVQPSRSMLPIKATAKGTSSSHHNGGHSMNAIKRNISWLAWQLAEFLKFSIQTLVHDGIYVLLSTLWPFLFSREKERCVW